MTGSGKATVPQFHSQQPVPKTNTYGNATFGAGAEAKIRLEEASTVRNKTSVNVIPIPEGRMRIHEINKYSSSLEANISRLDDGGHGSGTSRRDKSKSPAKTVSNVKLKNNEKTTNPFGEFDDDNTETATDTTSTNPFETAETAYDDNLNPFS